MLQRFISRNLICLILLLVAKDLYAWGALTHYYIASQVSGNEEFKINNLAPDIFAFRSVEAGFKVFGIRPYICSDEKEKLYILWEDIAHSPEPKTSFEENYPKPTNLGNEGWNDKPNIANMMLKITGYEGNNSLAQMARGYGAHIAADWIAHSTDKLTLPVLKGHMKTEKEIDRYVGLVHSDTFPTILSFRTNKELIRRGLMNYQLWLNLLAEKNTQIYTNPDFDLYDLCNVGCDPNNCIDECDIDCDNNLEELNGKLANWKQAAFEKVKEDVFNGRTAYFNCDIDIQHYINDFCGGVALWNLLCKLDSAMTNPLRKQLFINRIETDYRQFPSLIEDSIETVSRWKSWADAGAPSDEYAFGMHTYAAQGAPQREFGGRS